MLARGMSGSEMLTYNALSAMHNGTAGSSNPVDLSEYSYANLIVSSGSVDNFTINVKRAATSAAAGGDFGASINLSSGSQLVMRGFALDSSAVFYRVTYTGTGSANVTAIIQAQGARRTPITQNGATVLSEVL